MAWGSRTVGLDALQPSLLKPNVNMLVFRVSENTIASMDFGDTQMMCWLWVLMLVLQKEFLRRYISCAGYFEIVCENADSNQSKLLEVIVKKGMGEFLTIPSYKSTNISKPLEMTSAHPPFVHKSWPIALRRITQALASTRACEIEAMNELKKRFENNFAPTIQLWMISDDGNLNKKK
jgi:hypothetical protein